MAIAVQSEAAYEAEMVSRGMRKVTLWVKDSTEPGFELEYRRQMAVLSQHYRDTDFADLLEPDEEDLQRWT